MEKRCDLHMHSVYSDGSFTPAELVREAERIGLSAIALTDHNSTGGLSEFLAAGAGSSVTTVAGCEFSTEYAGNEVHIVGLFLAPETWNAIGKYVETMHIAKRESNHKLIENLQKAGYQITYEDVTAETHADSFNRAHVACVLQQKGYVESVRAAFDTVLSTKAGYYIPPKRLDALETVAFIKSIGGLAVMAHPFLNLDGEMLREFLRKASAAGLDAMETHYTEFDAEATARAIALAEEFGLLQSGGSDFHGKAKPDIMLGSGRGDLCVPYALYEALRQAVE